jgi:hypothetical protein
MSTPSRAGVGHRDMQHATRLTQAMRMLQRSRDETAQRVVQTSGTSGSAYRIKWVTSASSDWTLFLSVGTDQTENTTSTVKEVCLLVRYLALNALFLRASVRARMCLPSRWLAMGIHMTILKWKYICEPWLKFFVVFLFLLSITG